MALIHRIWVRASFYQVFILGKVAVKGFKDIHIILTTTL